MSRAHSSVPAKSNALSAPVPVSSQTVVPSVTGDGEVMSPLRVRWLPAPIGRFQRTAPVARSSAQSAIVELSSALSDTLRNTVLPDTIGVEPDTVGTATFHVTFSVADQVSGSALSLLTPSCAGPRHIGQSSAASTVLAAKASAAVNAGRRL